MPGMQDSASVHAWAQAPRKPGGMLNAPNTFPISHVDSEGRED